MIDLKYRQCIRCVMDTSDPEIMFDEQGYCNHCSEFLSKTATLMYKGKQSDDYLAVLLAEIKRKGQNKEYDCLIGVSGGVDSCFTAYVAKKLGLRSLIVHMDNGWNSEAAVNNIKHIAAKLEFDYMSYVLDWEEFKDLQLSFLKASVPEIETPTDIAIPAALHKIAAQYKIKYVLSGGNYATEGILPKSWHYNAKDVTYLKAIQKRFGTKKIKSIPTFGFFSELYFKFFKGIRIIYLLNYVHFSKKDAMQILEAELGWKYYGGKHYESKYTGFVQSFILPQKFNIDYRLATFSTQICTGEISREEAIFELTKTPFDVLKLEEEKAYINKKLGISTEEFSNLMLEIPKTYKDYPNDEKILNFIYKVYRWFHIC